MSEAYFEIGEYLSIDSGEVQGNFTDCLVFDSFINEIVTLEEFPWVTYFNVIDEVVDFSESFDNFHFPFINDSFSFSEYFPYSVRVFNSVVNVAKTLPVSPVEMYYLALDVVHGIDTYYFEPASPLEIQCEATICNMFFDNIYETIDFSQHEAFFAIRFLFSAADYFAIRDDVLQEYYFNNISAESLQIYPAIVRGFHHSVRDVFRLLDPVKLAHARTIESALDLVPACGSTWVGQETLADWFVSYDITDVERYYEKILEESIEFVVDNMLDAFVSLSIDDLLSFLDKDDPSVSMYWNIVESLVATTVSLLSFSCSEDVDSAMSFDSETLVSQLCNDVVLDTFDAINSPALSVMFNQLILDSFIIDEEMTGV